MEQFLNETIEIGDIILYNLFVYKFYLIEERNS